VQFDFDGIDSAKLVAEIVLLLYNIL